MVCVCVKVKMQVKCSPVGVWDSRLSCGMCMSSFSVSRWRCGVFAYDEQRRTFLPSSAWSCRSTGRDGCSPGWALSRDRFFTQPVMPEENFPPVRAAMSGAPPVTMNTHTHTHLNLTIYSNYHSELKLYEKVIWVTFIYMLKLDWL